MADGNPLFGRLILADKTVDAVKIKRMIEYLQAGGFLIDISSTDSLDSRIVLLLHGELVTTKHGLQKVEPTVKPAVKLESPKIDAGESQAKIPIKKEAIAFGRPRLDRKDIEEKIIFLLERDKLTSKEMTDRLDVSRNKFELVLNDMAEKGIIRYSDRTSGGARLWELKALKPSEAEPIENLESVENSHVTEDDIKRALQVLGHGTLRQVLKQIHGKDVPSTSYDYGRVNTLLTKMSRGEDAVLYFERDNESVNKVYIYSLKPDSQKYIQVHTPSVHPPRKGDDKKAEPKNEESPQVETTAEEQKVIEILKSYQPMTKADIQDKLNEDGVEADVFDIVVSLLQSGVLEKWGAGPATVYALKGFSEKLKNGKVYPIHGKQEKTDEENRRDELNAEILKAIEKGQPISKADIYEAVSESLEVSQDDVSKAIKHLLIDGKARKVGAGPGTKYVLPGYEEEQAEEEDEEIEEELGIGESRDDDDEETQPDTSAGPSAVRLSQPSQPEPADKELDIEELCTFLKSKIGKDIPTSPEELETFCEDTTDLWAQLVDNQSPLRKKIHTELGYKILIWETKNGLMVDLK